MQRSIRGFTMVELMVTLAVFAILAALAMPAFDGAFERSRADTEIESVVRVFNLARLEAINRGQNVRVQPIAEDGEWASALTVMLDADETVLRNVPALAAGATLEEEGDEDSIVFNGLGALQSPNAAVAFTYTRGDATRVVAVCVVGRVQTGEACQ